MATPPVAPPVGSTSPAPRCRFYDKGSCRFGDECTNRHVGNVPQHQKPRKSPRAGRAASGAAADPASGPSRSPPSSSPSSSKKAAMRPATDVVDRIRWDPDVPSDDFIVGYEDRFIGVQERAFNAFNWNDFASLSHTETAIPKHRIVYFKYKDQTVWHRYERIDDVFGSRGGKTLQDVIATYELLHPAEPGADGDNNDDHNDDHNDDNEDGESEGENGDEEQDAALNRNAPQPQRQRRQRRRPAAPSSSAATASPSSSPSPSPSPPPPSSSSSSSSGINLDKAPAPVPADRPNFFVSLRVTSPAAVAAVQRVQAHAVAFDPLLSKACIDAAALHLTLLTVHLETREDMQRAAKLLARLQPQVHALLPPSAPIHLRGLGVFRKQVLHGTLDLERHPRDAERLAAVHALLRDAFAAAGLAPVGNHDPFTAHMTILKLNRQLSRQVGNLQQNAYLPHMDTDFGAQAVAALHLCHMQRDKEGDGFYVRVCRVRNCPPDTVPAATALPALLARIAAPSPSEGKIPAAASAAAAAADDDQATSTPSPSPASVAAPTVVILRGLPGSGKSHLARALAAQVDGAVLCSADSYFTADGGEHAFAKELLGKAHQHCRQCFTEALAAHAPLVVIDNTNCERREYVPRYVQPARQAGYAVHVVELLCDGPEDVDAFMARGTHSEIPRETFEQMLAKWEPTRAKDVDSVLRVAPWDGATATAADGAAAADDAGDQTPAAKRPTGPSLVLCIAGLPSILFCGVFLSKEARSALLRGVRARHKNVHADHATLLVRPSPAEAATLPIGTRVELEAYAVVCDDRAQAVLVRLVESEIEAERSRALPVSTGRHLHITLSTSADTPPAYSNQLLAQAVEGGAADDADASSVSSSTPLPSSPRVVPLATPLRLEGTVGATMCAANDVRTSQRITTLTKLREAALGLDNLNRLVLAEPPLVRQLAIFDFDGTLFDSPGPVEGANQYWKATGSSWPHRGWVTHPESLRPPVQIRPGELLSVFRAYAGRAGTTTVVLTGRIEALRADVQRHLDLHGLAPDELLLKPYRSDDTVAFKCQALRELLQRYPHVTAVRVWDDSPDNLAGLQAMADSELAARNISLKAHDAVALSRRLARLETEAAQTTAPSAVREALRQHGWLRSDTYSSAAAEALRLLGRCWAATLAKQGFEALAADCAAGQHLLLPSGSYALGHAGDIDVILAAPLALSEPEWLQALEAALLDAGVDHTYRAESRRCPRLSIKLAFERAAPIELDLVVVRLGAEQLDSLLQRRRTAPLADKDASRAVGEGLAEWLRTGAWTPEQRSRLDGPQLLVRIQDAVAAAAAEQAEQAGAGAASAAADVQTLDVRSFCSAVDLLKLYLAMRGLRGNALNCVRSFQLVELALEALGELCPGPAPAGAALAPADRLFVALAQRMARTTESEWCGRLAVAGSSPRYARELRAAGAELAAAVFDRGLSLNGLLDLLQARDSAASTAGLLPVRLAFSAPTPAMQWHVHMFLTARLGNALLQLDEQGVAIVAPPPAVLAGCQGYRFFVSGNDVALGHVQTYLGRVWSDLDMFLAAGLDAEITVGEEKIFSRAGSSQLQGRAAGLILRQVEAFVAGEADELSLDSSLSAFERRLVHIRADELNLDHDSVGSGSDRHIVLRKRPQLED